MYGKLPESVQELRSRWQGPTQERALRRACRPVDSTLAYEVIDRLGIKMPHPVDMSMCILKAFLLQCRKWFNTFTFQRTGVHWNDAGKGVVAHIRMDSSQNHSKELLNTVKVAARVSVVLQRKPCIPCLLHKGN